MGGCNICTIQNNEETRSVFYNDKCDKYDYLAAVGCGAIAGLVDIFLVGAPNSSKLQPWTDAQVNKTVMLFAKVCGWSPKAGKENNVASAIGFLEKKFPVNYDQRHSGDVGGRFEMSAKNHHMKSLGHSPDIIGLFFSILGQFTSTAFFLSDGRLVPIPTESFELQGNSLIEKLFFGVANWFGHIMSDIAGSSGAAGRGSGIVIPFYELFGLFDNKHIFQNGQDRSTLSTLAIKVFQEGYDARFGLTMAIPVVLCDLSVKLIWALKHHFYHGRPIAECVPSKKHNDLRVMLILGNGILCMMDGIDAAVRSGGNWKMFFLRFNLIAWYRMIHLVLREVCIRLNINFSIEKYLNAFVQINDALTSYLSQLKQIDLERFKRETQQYNQMLMLMEKAETEEELNIILKKNYQVLGLPLPYDGDFDDFMKDSSSILEFK